MEQYKYQSFFSSSAIEPISVSSSPLPVAWENNSLHVLVKTTAQECRVAHLEKGRVLSTYHGNADNVPFILGNLEILLTK